MAFWSSRDAAPVQSHKFKVDWVSKDGKDVFALPWTVKSCTKPSIEINSGEYQVGNHVFKYPGIQKWQDITLVYVDDKNTTRRIIQMLIDHNWLNPVGSAAEGGAGSMGTPDGTRSGLYQPGMPSFGGTDTFDPIILNTNEGIQKQRNGGRELHITQFGVVSAQKVAEGGEERESTFFRPGAPAIMEVYHQGDAQVTSGVGLSYGSFWRFLEKWKLKNCWIKSINFGALDYYSDELINIEITVSFDYCHIDYGYMSKDLK